MGYTAVSNIISSDFIAETLPAKIEDNLNILTSGIVDTKLTGIPQNNGGTTVEMPEWDQIDDADEVIAEATNLTVRNMPELKDVGVICNRGIAIGFEKLAAWVSKGGDGWEEEVRNQLAGYVAKRTQLAWLKVLAGAVASLGSTHLSDVVPSAAITAITNASPGAVTSAGHGFSSGDLVTIGGVVGMTEVNGNTYTITVVDANHYTLGVDTSGFTTYVSGGVGSGTNTYINASRMQDARALMGEKMGALNAVICHSAVFSTLVKEGIAAYTSHGADSVVYDSGNIGGNIEGMAAVISDSIAVDTTVATHPEYLTYLVAKGLGAIHMNREVEIEVHNTPLNGQKALVVRFAFIPHIKGIAWSGSPSGQSPTNAELAASGNWTAIYSDLSKLKAVMLNSNG